MNRQVRQWLDEIANRRQHRETGQSPEERFRVETLRSLPALNSDYRDTAEVVVHKDLRLQFDGNRYCVPPRYVGPPHVPGEGRGLGPFPYLCAVVARGLRRLKTAYSIFLFLLLLRSYSYALTLMRSYCILFIFIRRQ